jgi:hypothetical protein
MSEFAARAIVGTRCQEGEPDNNKGLSRWKMKEPTEGEESIQMEK